MKSYLSILLLLACVGTAVAQEAVVLDSTDVFFRHIELKQVVVTGPTGAVKMQDMSMPAGVVDRNSLRMTPATNIVDAVTKLPGVSQVSTGSGISKPVIRGLGYNRVVVVADGVRQEGQQWGDEHGVEIDGNAVSSVEVLKGPASLLYGSDALAGVLKLNTDPVVPLTSVATSRACHGTSAMATSSPMPTKRLSMAMCPTRSSVSAHCRGCWVSTRLGATRA